MKYAKTYLKLTLFEWVVITFFILIVSLAAVGS